MRFGLFLQPLHHPSTNPTEALEHDLALIELLDELGYAEAWIGEHHSTGWENIGSPEVVIAAASERTSRIRLGTGVVQVGLHHPLVLLDRMILLDHLTRGRAMFGMGIGGGIPSDLSVFGVTPDVAARRMRESLEVMFRLLEEDAPVSAAADWFEIHEATLQLRPYTDPHPTMAVASGDPPNVRAMGKVGGQVLLGAQPERVSEVYALLESGAAEAGLSASREQIQLSYVLHLAETREQAVEGFRDGAIRELYEFQVGINGRPEPEGGPEEWFRGYVEHQIIGDPDDAVEKIEAILEVSGGVGGIIFMTRDWAGVEANRRSWELFADRVAPKFA